MTGVQRSNLGLPAWMTTLEKFIPCHFVTGNHWCRKWQCRLCQLVTDKSETTHPNTFTRLLHTELYCCCSCQRALLFSYFFTLKCVQECTPFKLRFFLKTSSMDTYASIFGQAQPFSGAWYGLHSDWLRCHSSRLSTSKTTSALLQGTAIFFFYIFCGINNRQEVLLCITTSNSNSGSYFHIDIPGLKNLPYFFQTVKILSKINYAIVIRPI